MAKTGARVPRERQPNQRLSGYSEAAGATKHATKPFSTSDEIGTKQSISSVPVVGSELTGAV
jgi:hypothetical protein